MRDGKLGGPLFRSVFNALLLVKLAACTAMAAGAEEERARDLHDFLIDANRAQLVMLAETELLARDQAEAIADALVDAAGAMTASRSRSSNYLDLEAELTRRLGPAGSNIHLGRSRNDLGAAMNRMALRAQMLDVLDALATARASLLELAADHTDTLIPGFTHGVQAQPTTLAHYLLALDAHFARDAARYEAAYGRLNRSPLGAAVFTGSGFALDRERLAELLGFEGLVENTYDAIVVSSGDSKAELTHAASLSALAVGRLAEDLLLQYDDPAPGLVLSEARTGRSSIMPQKRNPRLIERLRVSASEVSGGAVTVQFFIHNTPLHEVRDTRAPLFEKTTAVLNETLHMYGLLDALLTSIEVRPDALRARIDADYATMTELADTLHREAHVPFREGYAFASALTSLGRAAGKRPAEIGWDEANRVYREVNGKRLPIGPDAFAAALDPRAMLAGRRVRGGPQAGEIARLIDAARTDLEARRSFIAGQRHHIDQAGHRLDQAFAELR